jgi:hypothetical protein
MPPSDPRVHIQITGPAPAPPTAEEIANHPDATAIPVGGFTYQYEPLPHPELHEGDVLVVLDGSGRQVATATVGPVRPVPDGWPQFRISLEPALCGFDMGEGDVCLLPRYHDGNHS